MTTKLLVKKKRAKNEQHETFQLNDDSYGCPFCSPRRTNSEKSTCYWWTWHEKKEAKQKTYHGQRKSMPKLGNTLKNSYCRRRRHKISVIIVPTLSSWYKAEDHCLSKAKIVQYVPIKRSSDQAEGTVRRANYDLLTVLNTLIKWHPATRYNDIFAKLMELQTKNKDLAPNVYFCFHNRISTRLQIIFIGPKIFILSRMREWNLNAWHFGYSSGTQTVTESNNLWRWVSEVTL